MAWLSRAAGPLLGTPTSIVRAARLAVVSILVFCAGLAQGGQTSSIALSPDEQTVAAVAQDANGIVLWNWQSEAPVRFVPVGEEPRTLTFSPDGRSVWATCQRSQTLVQVDATQGKAVGTISLGGQPYGVLLSPDGRRAFVSLYAGGYVDGKYQSGLVAVVDLETSKPIARIPVKARPWAMALDATSSSLYITHFLNIAGKGWVSEIDTAQPFESQQLRAAREMPLLEDDSVADGRGGVFNALASIAIHPNHRCALVAGMHANVRRGIVINGQSLSHKTIAQAVVRVLDLATGRDMPEARVDSSFSGQAVAVPSAVAFIGGTDCFLDVYSVSHDFKILQYNERGLVSERAMCSLPDGPSGVAITRDGKTAFFNCRWDRSIAQFSLADLHAPKPVKTVSAGPEPWSPLRIQGARLFHNARDTRMTANRWIACGVCHLDGGVISDGLVWDMTAPRDQQSQQDQQSRQSVIGPMGSMNRRGMSSSSSSGPMNKISNTMDLMNLSVSSPPYFHRGSVNIAEDLEKFVKTFQQGSGFGTDSKEWDAIVAYIRSLRPRPNPHLENGLPRPEIRDSAERGRKLFLEFNRLCNSCHPGPGLTVSSMRELTVLDVGTDKPIDTPSLLNLWDTAPYLHDGRAATLLDVLTTFNRRDDHGYTSDLTPSQLEDLVNFMLAPAVKEPSPDPAAPTLAGIVKELAQGGTTSSRPVEPKADELLFSDDFNDGSFAGWTFLEGERRSGSIVPGGSPADFGNGELWVGPHTVLRPLGDSRASTTTGIRRDPRTGALHGELNGVPVEIGVFDGRLRLRAGSRGLHIVAAAGDPEWTDYRVDADVYSFEDSCRQAMDDSGFSFGVYGRLDVPNLPETMGEHSFVSAEFGGPGEQALRICCKDPEAPAVPPHPGALRNPVILGSGAFSIPKQVAMHFSAVYAGRHVEGWIDGRKLAVGEIPEDYPAGLRGRIALSSFGTWCEFDNVKVTRLAPASPAH